MFDMLVKGQERKHVLHHHREISHRNLLSEARARTRMEGQEMFACCYVCVRVAPAFLGSGDAVRAFFF